MDGIAADPLAGRAGQGRTPLLALDGFSGPLERLLTLARAQQVDLARVSLQELVGQLAAALHLAAPLAEKGDWVVMAAWLLLLRSNLLVSTDAPAEQAAEVEADQLRDRLVGLQEVQALATWLERRPQLGRDVFCRGQPEMFGTSMEAAHTVDVIEFLWASLALFDGSLESPDTTEVYRPRPPDLYPVPEARARILRLLAETPDGQPFERLLPEATRGQTETALRRRSAWTSTFAASLELAKQGEVTLLQDDAFTLMRVVPAAGSVPSRADLVAADGGSGSRFA